MTAEIVVKEMLESDDDIKDFLDRNVVTLGAATIASALAGQNFVPSKHTTKDTFVFFNDKHDDLKYWLYFNYSPVHGVWEAYASAKKYLICSDDRERWVDFEINDSWLQGNEEGLADFAVRAAEDVIGHGGPDEYEVPKTYEWD